MTAYEPYELINDNGMSAYEFKILCSEVRCTVCGGAVCYVEDGDTLGELLSTAGNHACDEGDEGS